jgi:hypothetical protein
MATRVVALEAQVRGLRHRGREPRAGRIDTGMQGTVRSVSRGFRRRRALPRDEGRGRVASAPTTSRPISSQAEGDGRLKGDAVLDLRALA